MSIVLPNSHSSHTDELPLRLSAEQFVAWVLRENCKAEWVAGEVIPMAPANFEHTNVRRWFDHVLSAFVRQRALGIVMDDFLLRITQAQRFRIPDLMFIAQARQAIIGDTMLSEPPDLIVEVISPDSAARDWREKYLEYEQFGVREYWIIDPALRVVEAYALNDTARYRKLPISEQRIHSTVVEGFWILPEWLWNDTRPAEEDALSQLTVKP